MFHMFYTPCFAKCQNRCRSVEHSGGHSLRGCSCCNPHALWRVLVASAAPEAMPCPMRCFESRLGLICSRISQRLNLRLNLRLIHMSSARLMWLPRLHCDALCNFFHPGMLIYVDYVWVLLHTSPLLVFAPRFSNFLCQSFSCTRQPLHESCRFLMPRWKNWKHKEEEEEEEQQQQQAVCHSAGSATPEYVLAVDFFRIWWVYPSTWLGSKRVEKKALVSSQHPSNIV